MEIGLSPNSLQLISDIHLDIRGKAMEISPSAPTLVVAGDVASHADPKYRDYLQTLFKNHRYGVLVPGNHDVWGAIGPIGQVLDSIESACKSLDTPVTLLRSGNWGFDVPGTKTRVVGATLWTHIPPELSDGAPSLLNDFKYIRTSPHRALTVDDVNRMHDTDKKWIARAVHEAGNAGRRAVVVTHHAPSMSLSAMNDAKARDGMGVFYYGDDMDSILRMPNICAWLYGHTHESWVLRLRGLDFPFVTNALGYPHEHTGFAEGAGIKIP
jgi:3',5'-cyclic AMP phosphodiesterase CpdA